MNKFIELFKSNISIGDLVNSLTVTWQGIIAIFIVMAIIALIVFFFARFSSKK